MDRSKAIPTILAVLLPAHVVPAPLLADGQPCTYESTAIQPANIPGFNEWVRLYDINDAGLAVGRVSLIGDYPCTWTAETGCVLLPKPAGVGDAVAGRVNNNGWILVNANTSQGFRGFVLIPYEGGYVWVPMLPPVPGDTGVAGINDLNQVVGHQSMGEEPDTQFPYGGFLWSPEGGRVDIQIPGWVATECTDINESGVICGDVSPTLQAGPVNGNRCFVLDGETVHIIEPLAPWDRTSSPCISNQGVVAGTVSQPATGGLPPQGTGFRWYLETGELEVLPLPEGFIRFNPRAINASGVLVGDLSEGSGQPNWLGVAFDSTIVHSEQLLPAGIASVASTGNAIRNDGVILSDSYYFPALALLHVPSSMLGDLTCDGVVDGADLAQFLAAWGTPDATADLNLDGVVDGADLGILLSNWTS